jgi:hypothetical protein
LVQRIEQVEEDEARWVAMRVLELEAQHLSAVPWSEEVLGPFEAAEVLSPYGAATIVRAAIISPGLAYAVWLHIPDAGIDQDTYRLFDLTCRSMKLTGG